MMGSLTHYSHETYFIWIDIFLVLCIGNIRFQFYARCTCRSLKCLKYLALNPNAANLLLHGENIILHTNINKAKWFDQSFMSLTLKIKLLFIITFKKIHSIGKPIRSESKTVKLYFSRIQILMKSSDKKSTDDNLSYVNR